MKHEPAAQDSRAGKVLVQVESGLAAEQQMARAAARAACHLVTAAVCGTMRMNKSSKPRWTAAELRAWPKGAAHPLWPGSPWCPRDLGPLSCALAPCLQGQGRGQG